MKYAIFAIAAIASYLVSAVNPSLLLARTVYHQDIRTVGSGNPGFTNFKRLYGWKLAWLVLLIDFSKTLLPCLVFGFAFRSLWGSFSLGAAYAGFFAMLGHAYPVWYRFRGGKAFLVAASAIWFIDWRVGLIAAGVFLLLLFTVQIMSVSSLSAALVCPIAMTVFGFGFGYAHLTHPIVLTCCVLSVLLLFWRHKANLDRLFHGKEPHFRVFGKNPK